MLRSFSGRAIVAMVGPAHPLDPVSDRITYYASDYGCRLEGQAYEDGWIFQMKLPLGQPLTPEGMPDDVTRLIQQLSRGVFCHCEITRDTLYIALWVPGRVYKKYIEGVMPEPVRPTGPIQIVPPPSSEP